MKLILSAGVILAVFHTALSVNCGSFGQAASGHLASTNLCYYIFEDAVGDRSWQDAEAFCASTLANGRLAILNTAEINTFVGDLLDSVNGEPRAWFGLSKPSPGNAIDYVWINGDSLDISTQFEAFNPGEHTDRPNFDDKCVQIHRGNQRWFARECADIEAFVCEGDPVDTEIIRDPHLMVQITGSDDPVCFDLKGKEDDKYQLVYDPERELTINCDILQYQNTSHSWFKGIAIMQDDCEVTMDVRKIIVNGQSVSWDMPTRNRACGRTATYSVTPEGHLMVQMEGNLQVTLRRDETKRYNVRFLDFYMSQHHDLSPLSHGLFGQFQGAKISLKPMSEKKSMIRFENDSTKSMSVVTKRMRKSVLKSVAPVACWFSGYQGYGIIDGAPSDYLVESLTFRGIAPKLEQFAKFDVNGAPGDDRIDGMF